jgi:hypothetical protein
VERLKKTLDGPRADLFRQIEVLRDGHDAEAALTQTCQKKLDDIQFSQEAKNSPGNKPEEGCLRELDTVRGVALHRGEAARLVGGRVYVGVRNLWAPEDAAIDPNCEIEVTVDKADDASKTAITVGQSLDLSTDVGRFRLVLTKTERENGRRCLFDLVRLR